MSVPIKKKKKRQTGDKYELEGQAWIHDAESITRAARKSKEPSGPTWEMHTGLS